MPHNGRLFKAWLVCLAVGVLGMLGPRCFAVAGRTAIETKASTKSQRKRWKPRSVEERMMWALGCELWRAGRDMALASSSVLRGEITAVDGQQKAAAKGTTSHLPTILQLGGVAMQDAGAALLDARWHLAIQQLERAADTSQEYWPSKGFESLIDFLFHTTHGQMGGQTRLRRVGTDPGQTLEHLARGLDVALDAIDQQIQYPHRERAELLLLSAAEILRDAVYLFDPRASDFSLPKDPRVVGVHFHDDDNDFQEDNLGTVNDQLEYVSVDMAATLRIREIQKELIRADNSDDPNGRKKLLSRLVRENHPDQNPGKEEEVRPVFEYCLKMLRLCKDTAQKLAEDLKKAVAQAERARIERQSQFKLLEVEAAAEEAELQRDLDQAKTKLQKLARKRQDTVTAHERQQVKPSLDVGG
eukprot:symbB.v1.2.004182.t1/scaffold233.1/size288367/13